MTNQQGHAVGVRSRQQRKCGGSGHSGASKRWKTRRRKTGNSSLGKRERQSISARLFQAASFTAEKSQRPEKTAARAAFDRLQQLKSRARVAKMMKAHVRKVEGRSTLAKVVATHQRCYQDHLTIALVLDQQIQDEFGRLVMLQGLREVPGFVFSSDPFESHYDNNHRKARGSEEADVEENPGPNSKNKSWSVKKQADRVVQRMILENCIARGGGTPEKELLVRNLDRKLGKFEMKVGADELRVDDSGMGRSTIYCRVDGTGWSSRKGTYFVHGRWQYQDGVFSENIPGWMNEWHSTTPEIFINHVRSFLRKWDRATTCPSDPGPKDRPYSRKTPCLNGCNFVSRDEERCIDLPCNGQCIIRHIATLARKQRDAQRSGSIEEARKLKEQLKKARQNKENSGRGKVANAAGEQARVHRCKDHCRFRCGAASVPGLPNRRPTRIASEPAVESSPSMSEHDVDLTDDESVDFDMGGSSPLPSGLASPPSFSKTSESARLSSRVPIFFGPETPSPCSAPGSPAVSGGLEMVDQEELVAAFNEVVEDNEKLKAEVARQKFLLEVRAKAPERVVVEDEDSKALAESLREEVAARQRIISELEARLKEREELADARVVSEEENRLEVARYKKEMEFSTAEDKMLELVLSEQGLDVTETRGQVLMRATTEAQRRLRQLERMEAEERMEALRMRMMDEAERRRELAQEEQLKKYALAKTLHARQGGTSVVATRCRLAPGISHIPDGSTVTLTSVLDEFTSSATDHLSSHAVQVGGNMSVGFLGSSATVGGAQKNWSWADKVNQGKKLDGSEAVTFTALVRHSSRYVLALETRDSQLHLSYDQVRTVLEADAEVLSVDGLLYYIGVNGKHNLRAWLTSHIDPQAPLADIPTTFTPDPSVIPTLSAVWERTQNNMVMAASRLQQAHQRMQEESTEAELRREQLRVKVEECGRLEEKVKSIQGEQKRLRMASAFAEQDLMSELARTKRHAERELKSLSEVVATKDSEISDLRNECRYKQRQIEEAVQSLDRNRDAKRCAASTIVALTQAVKALHNRVPTWSKFSEIDHCVHVLHKEALQIRHNDSTDTGLMGDMASRIAASYDASDWYFAEIL